MNEYLAECVGTCIITTFGCGVVAGVLLEKSKSYQAGWLVICLGWAFAVMLSIYAVGSFSEAHFNPAISIALAIVGKFEASKLLFYIISQILGAFVGAIIVYVFYFPHWSVTKDADLKLAVYCTSPAIKHTFSNFISEFIATFFLMIGILFLGLNEFSIGLKPFIVGLLILTIGLCLGGTTGWAINPARDFGPRLAHFLLPISGKRDSDWSYAWIPILAPICGAIAAVFVFEVIF